MSQYKNLKNIVDQKWMDNASTRFHIVLPVCWGDCRIPDCLGELSAPSLFRKSSVSNKRIYSLRHLT